MKNNTLSSRLFQLKVSRDTEDVRDTPFLSFVASQLTGAVLTLFDTPLIQTISKQSQEPTFSQEDTPCTPTDVPMLNVSTSFNFFFLCLFKPTITTPRYPNEESTPSVSPDTKENPYDD